MLVLYGKGVSSGIATGRAFVLHRERPTVPEYVLPKHLLDEEVARFLAAAEAARRQLKSVREHIPANAPAEAASFIDAHLMILDDTMISQAPIEIILRNQCNAEWALQQQSERLIEVFEKMEDPYLRSKKTDVTQVVDRVLRNLLSQSQDEHEQLQGDLDGCIVVATDLTPADTVLLKHKHIRAFVTDLGGPISHTAILARSLGIPAIVAAHSATRWVLDNEDLIVDGKRGVLIVAPDAAVNAEYAQRQRDIERFRKELNTLKASPAVTRDAHPVTLLANIELPEDIPAVQQVVAAGVGLYRTEFLFLNRAQPPDEEEQLRAYLKVVRALPGKPVTIRTLDLGGDKQLDSACGEPGPTNPALGLRAIRMCLNDIGLFRPQLRAILRASAHGPVRLMIPMLANLSEVARVLDLIRDLKRELTREGTPFDDAMPVGGMIEVPAAAVAADLFATKLDFLSIGTNDLIQYTLAIDRLDDSVSYLYDPLHPAVLRLIEMTIDAGKHAKIPVAMCGEMAGDTRYTRLLLGLGLEEFSMHPSALLEVKKIVRESDLAQLRARTRELMQLRDIQALHEAVERMNG